MIGMQQCKLRELPTCQAGPSLHVDSSMHGTMPCIKKLPVGGRGVARATRGLFKVSEYIPDPGFEVDLIIMR